MDLFLFFKHNWLAIFYFNFKMLPFRQAIKLPFDFYCNVKFKCTRGNVKLESCKINRGMFKFGAQGSDMFSDNYVIIDLKGKLILKGCVSIGTGSLLRIEKNGTVTFEDNVVIGAKTIILCEDSITVKTNTITAWNCQIMDTDTHSLMDIYSGQTYSRFAPVVIGERCWIGNNVIINKGVILPNNTTVASNSLCNKDYTKVIQPFSVIGGIPANLIIKDRKRLDDKLG